MKRLACLLLVVVMSCGGPPKDTLDFPSKCNLSPNMAWRYSHTEYWTPEEPVYEYHYDWYSSKWEWGLNGTETVQHSRDVWSCQHRR